MSKGCTRTLRPTRNKRVTAGESTARHLSPAMTIPLSWWPFRCTRKCAGRESVAPVLPSPILGTRYQARSRFFLALFARCGLPWLAAARQVLLVPLPRWLRPFLARALPRISPVWPSMEDSVSRPVALFATRGRRPITSVTSPRVIPVTFCLLCICFTLLASPNAVALPPSGETQ